PAGNHLDLRSRDYRVRHSGLDGSASQQPRAARDSGFLPRDGRRIRHGAHGSGLMRALDLDYQAGARRSGIGTVVLAAGVLMATVALVEYRSVVEEQAAWESR